MIRTTAATGIPSPSVLTTRPGCQVAPAGDDLVPLTRRGAAPGIRLLRKGAEARPAKRATPDPSR
ncbi:hypothetical protein [Streptomyces sp. NPDC048603]|uniref:hypothetical protein n=1 Tax=Streptomyces sp. NPDC048603 TaxID=3365577 RepID=UPI00371B02A5